MTWGSGRPWLRAWLRGVIARHLVAADPDDAARARASRVRMQVSAVYQYAKVACPDCTTPADRTDFCPGCGGRRHTHQHGVAA